MVWVKPADVEHISQEEAAQDAVRAALVARDTVPPVDRRIRAFFRGVGSVLVIMPTVQHAPLVTWIESPEKSLSAQWRRVGDYLRAAIEEYGGEQAEQESQRSPTA